MNLDKISLSIKPIRIQLRLDPVQQKSALARVLTERFWIRLHRSRKVRVKPFRMTSGQTSQGMDFLNLEIRLSESLCVPKRGGYYVRKVQVAANWGAGNGLLSWTRKGVATLQVYLGPNIQQMTSLFAEVLDWPQISPKCLKRTLHQLTEQDWFRWSTIAVLCISQIQCAEWLRDTKKDLKKGADPDLVALLGLRRLLDDAFTHWIYDNSDTGRFLRALMMVLAGGQPLRNAEKTLSRLSRTEVKATPFPVISLLHEIGRLETQRLPLVPSAFGRLLEDNRDWLCKTCGSKFKELITTLVVSLKGSYAKTLVGSVCLDRQLFNEFLLALTPKLPLLVRALTAFSEIGWLVPESIPAPPRFLATECLPSGESMFLPQYMCAMTRQPDLPQVPVAELRSLNWKACSKSISFYLDGKWLESLKPTYSSVDGARVHYVLDTEKNPQLSAACARLPRDPYICIPITVYSELFCGAAELSTKENSHSVTVSFEVVTSFAAAIERWLCALCLPSQVPKTFPKNAYPFFARLSTELLQHSTLLEEVIKLRERLSSTECRMDLMNFLHKTHLFQRMNSWVQQILSFERELWWMEPIRPLSLRQLISQAMEEQRIAPPLFGATLMHLLSFVSPTDYRTVIDALQSGRNLLYLPEAAWRTLVPSWQRRLGKFRF